MSHSHENKSEHEHSDFVDKLKHPFHDLKEKLKDTHLHDAKVSLIHKKYVYTLLANLEFEILIKM